MSGTTLSAGPAEMNGIGPLSSKNLWHWFGDGSGVNTGMAYERGGKNISISYFFWIGGNVWKLQKQSSFLLLPRRFGESSLPSLAWKARAGILGWILVSTDTG